MKVSTHSKRVALALAPLVCLPGTIASASGEPPTAAVSTEYDTAFTYHGQLAYQGTLVNDTCQFKFQLFDSEQAGTPLAQPVVVEALDVVDGLFAITLDFGVQQTEEARFWLQTTVNGVTLSPRQAVPAPDRSGEGRSESEGRQASVREGSDVVESQGRGQATERNQSAPPQRTQELRPQEAVQDVRGRGRLGPGAGPDGVVVAGGGDRPDSTDTTVSRNLLGGTMWQLNENDIYYLNGNVGIGTPRPGHPLTVRSHSQRTISATNTKDHGDAVAIRGHSESKSGQGIVGLASSPSGQNFGLIGRTNSVSGTGVFGQATALSGTTVGVFGEVNNPAGFAGYFVGGRNYFEGNVGIATLTPSQALDVVGNIAVSGTVDGLDIGAHAADANAHHTPPTTLPPSGPAGGDLSGTYPNPSVDDDSHSHGDGTIDDNISIDNTRLFAPSGAGNVGVGTSTPGERLDVIGNIAVSGTVDGLDIAAHAADANAHHTPPTSLPPSGAAGGDLSGTYPNPSVDDDSHSHGDGTIDDDMSIDNTRLFAPAGAGNVGIGTNTPGEKLDVAGNIAVSGTVDGVDIAAHAADADAHHTPPTTLPPSGAAGGDLSGTYPNPSVDDDSHSHGDGTIDDDISIDNTRLFAPTGAGNVGIGTNTPGERLDVAGNIAVSGTVDGLDIAAHAADANAHHTPPTSLPPSGAAGGDLSGTYPNPSVDDDSHSHGDGTVSDNISINNTRLVAPAGAGNVGISRVAVTNALEVEGNASKSSGAFWLTNSDARIKTGVTPISDALKTLNRVNLVSFRYLDEYRTHHPRLEDRPYFNVLAQEFQEVFPNHVGGSGETLPGGEEILQVDSYPLTIYSAAAIQELHAIVQSQDQEIASLHEELGATNLRLERLEMLVAEFLAEQE